MLLRTINGTREDAPGSEGVSAKSIFPDISVPIKLGLGTTVFCVQEINRQIQIMHVVHPSATSITLL